MKKKGKKNSLPLNSKDIKDFVIKWNTKYPYDKWWREKYKVPFFSEEHLKANPIMIKAEYIEDQMYQKEIEKAIREQLGEEEKPKEAKVDHNNIDWDALDKQLSAKKS
jgi:hypothetical protein